MTTNKVRFKELLKRKVFDTFLVSIFLNWGHQDNIFRIVVF